MDNYSSKYDNFILLDDLNSESTESAVRGFCEIYSCKNLIKDNTCFKNPLKPSCIDLIITNRSKSFKNSVTVESGLPDFHKMTLTVMKIFYKIESEGIRTFASRTTAPWTIAPWMIAPQVIAPRTIAPKDNCLRGKLPPGQLPPGQFPPRKIAPEENCLPDNCPLDDCSQKITVKIITS